MRIPNIVQLKESPRNHRKGIPAVSPVIAQTTPKNTAARPENGTSTPYFIGSVARMTKNTPTPIYVAAPVRITYIINGEFGSVSIPKNLAIDSHADKGRNNPAAAVRHKIPVTHKQIFNARILDPFQ
jgi:hypothetical protein